MTSSVRTATHSCRDFEINMNGYSYFTYDITCIAVYTEHMVASYLFVHSLCFVRAPFVCNEKLSLFRIARVKRPHENVLLVDVATERRVRVQVKIGNVRCTATA